VATNGRDREAAAGGFIEVGVDVLIVIVILFGVVIIAVVAVLAALVTAIVFCLPFVTFWDFV
jgi:hypothetical protein